jgi:hypothetical protein
MIAVSPSFLRKNREVVPAHIRTQHLPNTGLQRYCCSVSGDTAFLLQQIVT